MKYQPALDLSKLPLHGSGNASLTWWGTLTFMLLEGTGFALAIAIYLYLGSLAPEWPLGAPLPDLLLGTLITLVLVGSLIPNALTNHWAKQKNLALARLGIVVMSLTGVIPLIIRAYEFPAVHISWDSNAYGSIVWFMLGLHTTHILTDLADTLVLAALMFTWHGNNQRRFGDMQDNAMYWNFVVLTWLPLYFCIYWVPRL
jgi:cytochrome c oxidase subunit 3